MIRSAIAVGPMGAIVWLACLFAGCDHVPAAEAGPGAPSEATAGPSADDPGPLVTPPFVVTGELDGLLLVWFDEHGAHSAERLSEVPEAHRRAVRVDSLAVAPDKRLPPDQVYLADLRKPMADGSFQVRKVPRARFDAMVDKRIEEAAPKAEEVVVYKASWCGVCKQAAAYLRAKNVPFIEKDVEKDAGADAEMRSKAAAAGKRPRGVPVIDFRGRILLGFDRPALESLISEG